MFWDPPAGITVALKSSVAVVTISNPATVALVGLFQQLQSSDFFFSQLFIFLPPKAKILATD